MPHGRRLGLVDDATWTEYEQRQARAVRLEKWLATAKVNIEKLQQMVPELFASLTGDVNAVNGQTYAQLLKRPEVTLDALKPVALEDESLRAEWADVPEAMARLEWKTVETEVKYVGYLDQQRKSMEKMKRDEGKVIPEWFDYTSVSGLSREMQEKLGRVRPRTLGQAGGIPGVTPAAVTLLHVYIELQGKQRNAASMIANGN